MKFNKAWTAALAVGSLLVAAQAGAAVVSVSSSFNVNATTQGYGNDSAGFYHNHYDQTSFNQGTLASYSQSVAQSSTPAPVIAPGTAYGDITASGSQNLASTGLLTLDASGSSNATASCTPSPCSQYQGNGGSQLSFSFTLTTPYEYKFDFNVERTSGSNGGNVYASGYLYSNTTNSYVWSGGNAFLSVTGSATASLFQTGLIGPGTYQGNIYFQNAAYSSSTTPSFISGTGDLEFSLTPPVPLPAAAWLLLSGLAGMGAVARRRKAHAST